MSDKLVEEAPYHPGYEDAAMKPAMRNVNATHVDFGFLRGMIPSNPHFMPSNIDMVLERKGRFLFGEWKREGETMKKGQQILLQQLSWYHPVLVITGYVDKEPHISLIEKVIPGFDDYEEIGKSSEDLIRILQNWYKAIERTPK